MTTYRGQAAAEKRAIRERTTLRYRIAEARRAAAELARIEAEAAADFAVAFEQGLEVLAPRDSAEEPETWADLY